MSHRKRQVGVITQATIDLLGLTDIEANKEICVGPTNISHMKRSHPEDFTRYGDRLEDVIQYPHYVMLHPSDGSIRFIREYIEDGNRVLVAVRASSGGSFFARSLYTIEVAKLESYRNTGNLVDYADENNEVINTECK